MTTEWHKMATVWHKDPINEREDTQDGYRDADEQWNTQEAQRKAKETQNKQKHTQSDHKAMSFFCNCVFFSLMSLAPVWEGWWTFYKSVWLYGVTDSSYLFIAINIKILKLELLYYSELLCLVHHCLQHGPFFTDCTDETLSSKLCSSLPEYAWTCSYIRDGTHVQHQNMSPESKNKSSTHRGQSSQIPAFHIL